MNRPLLDQWAEVMAKGDWMMWILMTIALLLWSSLGFRALLLQRGTKKPLLELLDDPPVYQDEGTGQFRGFIVEAVAAANKVRQTRPRPWANDIDSYLHPLSERLNSLRAMVTALVALAPMAGLLGTVSGMMVMFNSIGESSFSSQTGGITNGISQALFTTEAALVVAVPCLIVGRILNRKEDEMRLEMEQLLRLVCAKSPEDQP